MKTNMTKHARVDREDRFNKILSFMGIGEAEYQVEQSNHTDQILTTTGLMIIKSKDTNKIVTFYVPNVEQVLTIYRRATGRKKVPNSIIERAKRNYSIFASL